MIKAEQLLLEVALQDHANQRFVLISDRLVPFLGTLWCCNKLVNYSYFYLLFDFCIYVYVCFIVLVVFSFLLFFFICTVLLGLNSQESGNL